MVQTSPTPFEVGRAFVHQYYTLLHQAPNLLHRFYSSDSTFIHGAVDRLGSIEQPAVGPDDIAQRIKELNLRDCHAKIRQVDSHPTIGNGVVVQVTGELSNNGQPMRRFMQTFVLAPRQPKKYYVQNDIFRYQDEVFDDGSEEDDGSSSPNYVDTDKVSNADSSAAITQQSMVVTNTSRQAAEEQQQHQPLPPRNTGHHHQQQQQQQQPQPVIPNQTIQQDEQQLDDLNASTGYTVQHEQNQENQQQTKQTTTEGTSYAGIAKLQPSSGQTSTVNLSGPSSLPAQQQTNSTRPANVKSGSNRTNNQQRNNQNIYYQQNNRGNYWNDGNQQDPSPGRRSRTSMISAPNEQQVFVGSLPADFTRETLITCFSQFGNVVDARIHAPNHENKKNFGFVVFDDPNIATKVVQREHIDYQNTRLNVEAKTQKSYQGNSGSQGNARNHNYQNRGAGGINRGGSRGSYRNSGNNSRRGGGHFLNNSPSFTSGDENFKVQSTQQ